MDISFSRAGMLYVSASYFFNMNLLHKEFQGYKFSEVLWPQRY